MVLPSNHLLKYVPGVEFDFRFQYIAGSAGSTTPVNLTNYLPTWIITDVNGDITSYNLSVPGHSGVFFGGDTNNLTTGIIDLILISNDTTALLEPAQYQFNITPNDGAEIPLLFGAIVNANPVLYVGNPPPTQVINGGNAYTIFSNDINGGNA